MVRRKNRWPNMAPRPHLEIGRPIKFSTLQTSLVSRWKLVVVLVVKCNSKTDHSNSSSEQREIKQSVNQLQTNNALNPFANIHLNFRRLLDVSKSNLTMLTFNFSPLAFIWRILMRSQIRSSRTVDSLLIWKFKTAKKVSKIAWRSVLTQNRVQLRIQKFL